MLIIEQHLQQFFAVCNFWCSDTFPRPTASRTSIAFFFHVLAPTVMLFIFDAQLLFDRIYRRICRQHGCFSLYPKVQEDVCCPRTVLFDYISLFMQLCYCCPSHRNTHPERLFASLQRHLQPCKPCTACCARIYLQLLLQVKSIENGEEQGFTPLCVDGVPDNLENAAFIGSAFR
jgi:hypothetical protein